MPHHYTEGTSFSILFPMTTNSHPKYYYSSSSSSTSMDPSSSSVDCTLSLGTPSTRQSDNHANGNSNGTSTTSKLPINGYWDFLMTTSSKPSSRDHLLHARRCANCDTTSTPLWRNGPKGPKSLCNACGIRYKKEERRAAVSSTTSSTSSCASVSKSGLNEKVVSYGYQQAVQHNPWSCYGSSGTGIPISMFTRDNDNDDDEDDEDDVDEDQGYLSWRLNMVQPSSSSSQFHHVRDNRPCSLFQYQ